jgi:hypothetical protein
VEIKEEQEAMKYAELGRREVAKEIIGEISTYEPYTCYRVQEGILYVYKQYKNCKSIQESHADIIRGNKDLLIEYLTKPPEMDGECIRGHKIDWVCMPYGTWVCKCYYERNDTKWRKRRIEE